MDNLKFLKGIDLFKNLSSLDIIELSKFIKRKFYTKGEIIIREGTLCSTFYMIKSGTAMIARGGKTNENLFVAKLTHGRYFGELSLFDFHPIAASVLAEEDVETFELKKDDFDIFVDTNRDLAIKIYRTIGKTLFEKLKYCNLGLNIDFDI